MAHMRIKDMLRIIMCAWWGASPQNPHVAASPSANYNHEKSTITYDTAMTICATKLC